MGSLNPEKMIHRFCVLICAHNEAERIGGVVQAALEQAPWKVVVVDDGSDDATAELAEQAGAFVLQNLENLGKGASLRRGFELIRDQDCDAVVVVDGDGQHDPREIPRFLDTYRRTGIPILIGNRMANTSGMPLIRRWTNRSMCYALNRLTKIYVADPPCGFRFYRADVLPFILSRQNRFAFEFDILIHAAQRHIRVDSVRISTIYFSGKQSQVAPLRDAWLLFKSIVYHYYLNKKQV